MIWSRSWLICTPMHFPVACTYHLATHLSRLPACLPPHTHYQSLPLITIQHNTLASASVYYITAHLMTVQYNNRQHITIHDITPHYIPIHALDQIRLRRLDYAPLHKITLHRMVIHHIALGYITLHYIRGDAASVDVDPSRSKCGQHRS